MRGLRRCAASFAAVIAIGFVGSGCQTLRGGPDRLYPVADEVAQARAWVETATEQYYRGPQTEFLRNEIIARRMYIIDVEYTQYEAALTRERQEVGFFTSTTAQGLNIAGALVTPAQTTKILSGLAGGVGSIRGYYDSEIVIAKTIQIAQGHMQRLRAQVSDKIKQAMSLPLEKYPFSLALSDLEDYYRAGTLAAGLVEAVGISGSDASQANRDKQSAIEITFGLDADTQTPIEQFLAAGGADARRALNAILRNPPLNSSRRILDILYDNSPEAKALRIQVVRIARSTIPKFPR